MNKIRDFKDLIVWQKAMDLAVEVYHSDIERAFGLIKEVGKMLNSLQKSLISPTLKPEA